jgi:bifunctional UDP-N-acetylglucosamine pyrophosphorylase/glucosamine-1-phosphate N-acetyltransferase
MRDLTAVILAAGKGTRMRSRTNKVLHPVLGRPLLAYPIAACRAAGVGRIVIVVGHQHAEVRDAVGAPDVDFAVQEEQKGTGHAVLCAREALGSTAGTLLILCGDVPLIRPETLLRLVERHRGTSALATVLSMEPGDPGAYGRLVRDRQGALLRIVEARDAAAGELAIGEVNTGTYAAEMPWLWEALAGVGAANEQGEYYLTDVIEQSARAGRASSLLLEDPDEVIGVNSRAELAEVGAVLRGRINRDWMEAGVTLEDPDRTWIEPDVVLEPDVVIGPACRLSGRTRVATGAHIEQGAVIRDSDIGPGARLLPYCVLTEARVGLAAQVGPFAHLRPGATLEEASKVGNFVEIKKSVLGRGSKANHLTYLGDTTVGEKANIGAGTITCNYDGTNKHQTRIGDRAFIGSNTSLVDPVEIGSGASVAAGSTITQDVPPASLGVGRARQRNVADWASRREKIARRE